MPINPGRILFEDEHLLAVNKLSGELVVKGAGRVDKLPLLDFLKKTYPGLRPLNRLDFETSGIVLFAKTKAAFEAMKDAFEERDPSLRKIYRTIVKGHFKERNGEIDLQLKARSDGAPVPAHTTYTVLEQFPIASYVEADITTGRKHQIRQHFAKIGHPLALDSVYGDEKFNRLFMRQFRYARFFLHAAELHFHHPITGENVMVKAETPQAFTEVLGKLRKM